MGRIVLALIVAVLLTACQTQQTHYACEDIDKSDPVKYLKCIGNLEVFGDLHHFISNDLERTNIELLRKYKTSTNVRTSLIKEIIQDRMETQKDPLNHKPIEASIVGGRLSHLLGWWYCGYSDTTMQGVAIYNRYGGLEAYAENGAIHHAPYVLDAALETLTKSHNFQIIHSLTEDTKGLYALIIPVINHKSKVDVLIGFTIFYFKF